MTASEPGPDYGKLGPGRFERPPRLTYLVTEDWYFCSHRLPMARAARDAGFKVTVATRVDRHAAQILAEGFRLIPLTWRRRSIDPISLVRQVLELVRLYRRDRPDIVHHVAMKPAALGGLAARLAGVPAQVSAVAGLGWLFASHGLRARLIRAVLKVAMPFLISRRGARLLAQNAEDAESLVAAGWIDRQRTVVIRGSGIDVSHYTPPAEEPSGPVIVGFAARMLEQKGVRTLVEAHRRARADGHDIRLRLAGMPDPDNPATIPLSTLRAWDDLPGVEWLGFVEDVASFWRGVHIGALVSRGEGLPKCLLEAAACARPLIASDTPGCREVAVEGVNALLVPPDDVGALAAAMRRLADDAKLRAEFGAQSRRLVETDMTDEAVGRATVTLYRSLIEETGGPPMEIDDSGIEYLPPTPFYDA